MAASRVKIRCLCSGPCHARKFHHHATEKIYTCVQPDTQEPDKTHYIFNQNHEKQQQIVLAKYYLTLVLAKCITLVLAKFKKTNLGRKKQAEVFFLFFLHFF